MGKTSTLLHFKEQLERKHPNFFHYFVQLQKFTSSFISDDKFDKNLQITVQTIHKMIGITKSFDQSLFMELFKKKKVVLMFDGFDEISPKYSKFVIQLLIFCHNQCQMWVSTRSHLTHELVKALDSPSFRILPFNHEDKANFFFKFWAQESENHAENLIEIARNLVDRFSSTVNYEVFNDFIGIPLQIRMLAEIFKENFGESMEGFVNSDNEISFYQFYDYFIRMKLKIRKNKGEVAADEEIHLENEEISIIQFHCVKALTQVLGADQISLLSIVKRKQKALTAETISRLGILQLTGDGDFRFVHQTFAEFFVSRYLITSLTDFEDSTELTRTVKLFVEMLIFGKYRVIRTFLNSEMNPENLSEAHVNTIQSVCIPLADKISLFRLVRENQHNLLKILISSIKSDKKILKKLFTEVYESGTSLLQVAAEQSSLKLLQTLWHEISTNFPEDCEKLLIHEDAKQRQILFYACTSRSYEMFEFILQLCRLFLDQKFASFLSIAVLNIGNIVHETIMFGQNSKIFELICDTCVEILGQEVTRDAILATRSFLTSALINKTPGILNAVISKTEQIFTKAELKKIFQDDLSNFFLMFFNMSHRMIDKFWFLFCNLFETAPEQCEQLLRWDENGKNVLMSLVCIRDFDVFSRMFQKLEEIFGKSNYMKVLLLDEDFRGEGVASYFMNVEIRDFVLCYVEANMSNIEQQRFRKYMENPLSYAKSAFSSLFPRDAEEQKIRMRNYSADKMLYEIVVKSDRALTYVTHF
jgi:hypothetical protein